MTDSVALVVALVVVGFAGYAGLQSRQADQVRRFLRLFTGRQRMPKWKRRYVWLASGGRCSYCGIRVTYRWRNTPDSLEVDHRTPHSWGGSDSLPNLAASCMKCNRAFGAKAKRRG